LFEHLMFNEAKHLAAGEFDRRIEAVGGETNAATWVDWTYYRDLCGRDHLDLLLSLEAERLAHLVLREAQILSERQVVANERRFRVEDDVGGFLEEQLWALAFGDHPYGAPTIGWMDDIQGFRRDDCKAFYATYYSPNNAVLIVVGDFNEREALERIATHYGAMAPQAIPRETPRPEPVATREQRARFIKPTQTEQLQIAYRALPLAHPDQPTLDLAAELLSGGPGSRLHRALVVDREICSTVAAFSRGLAHAGLFEVHAVLKRGRTAAEAEEVVTGELERLAAAPPAADEIARVRARLESGFLWELRDASGKAQALGHFELTGGDFRRLFEVAERYPRIEPEEVQRVAAATFARARRTVVVAVPSPEAE
jgi:zinc protease